MEKYENGSPSSVMTGSSGIFGLLKDYRSGRADRRPSDTSAIPVMAYQPVDAEHLSEASRLTWFGHSAFLLELEGKRLLFDPMLGNRPSPVSWVGSKRYNRSLPAQPENLPEIDAVILSHDHYDHLDYSTILKLKNKTRRFLVPMGVRKILLKWGVSPEKVTEHAWWDKCEVDGFSLVCTPAQHFSGRGLIGRNRTLWCSWVINGEKTKIFFSGDSGYGPHFQEIGAKYGPFDLTVMECGQYNERWSDIHMMPEQTVQAHLDLGGKLMIPVHWSAFTLSLHSWTEPVERVTKAAANRNVTVSTPKIGEPVDVNSGSFPVSTWWREGR
ncbi:MBL fold metallo-hydrolase [Gorillibacterium massiliense]|uniref:MBL fold metallo-hydrolase n=1 Tax=Gorillibacterium massiliense TaxID=1280390 RepID=UPI0004B72257|nr:MBL fold metallo-hydrolase [Gorillibacterium massiliense]